MLTFENVDLILYSNMEKHWFSISKVQRNFLEHGRFEFEADYQVQG